MNFGQFAGTLAGQLRAKTPGELIAAIGDAVAPPLESDGEYESGSEYTDDDEEGDYYDDEEEEYDVDVADNDKLGDQDENHVFDYSVGGNGTVSAETSVGLFSDVADKWSASENLERNETAVAVMVESKNDDIVENQHAEPVSVSYKEISAALDTDITTKPNQNETQNDAERAEKGVDNVVFNNPISSVTSAAPAAASVREKTEIEEPNVILERPKAENEPSADQNASNNNNYAEELPTSPAENKNSELSHDIPSSCNTVPSISEELQAQELSQLTQQTLQLQNLLNESNLKLEGLQQQLQSEQNKRQTDGHRHQRAMQQYQIRDKELSELLEDRQRDSKEARKTIDQLKVVLQDNSHQVALKDKEIQALKRDNDEYKSLIQQTATNLESKDNEIYNLEEEKQKLQGVQMELQMLKEACDRDRIETKSNLESATSTQSKIASERDAYKAQVLDLQNQLTAAQADLSIAKSDYDRAITANTNLEKAMQAIQSEREAEQGILQEHNESKEKAYQDKHQAELEALHDIHQREIHSLQIDHDRTVKSIMSQIQAKEQTITLLQKESLNLRRSLDEAIHRLQLSQEDVIDRTLMKNILLDWLNSKRQQKNKKQVLEVMASVLHFTEEEKDLAGVGLRHHAAMAERALGKVVGAVAAPLPQPVLQCDRIEGENVREKWVNFLLAETGGGEDEVIKHNDTS